LLAPDFNDDTGAESIDPAPKLFWVSNNPYFDGVPEYDPVIEFAINVFK
jgi:hypothetical protein